MKACTKCGEAKPEAEFSKQTSRRDGLRSHCKACVKVKSAEYCDDNREKINIASAAYKIANPGIFKEWRAANMDKVRASNNKWNAANPEKVKAAIAKWNADNPEARRIYDQNRRAHKAGGKLSKGLTGKLVKLQRGKCACGCKQPLGDKFHLDHIMPLKLGGTNTDDNIQLLRSTCNLQKHAKHPVDFMQQRGYLL